MALILQDILQILDRIAPSEMAEEWDNVGLQVGGLGREVEWIWVALDPSIEVVSAACREGVGLLVTHHPLIFRPLRRIDTQTSPGTVIEAALRHGLAIYTMHTNLDAAPGGLNDLLAKKVGLRRIQPLTAAAGRRQRSGLGRRGELPRRLPLSRLAWQLKQRMKLENVRIVGNLDTPVKRVAVSTGSGGSLVPSFLASAAEVFITGDLRYHDAREIETAGRCAIDIGHFHSEYLMTSDVTQRLRQALKRRHAGIRVQAYLNEKEPFRTA